MTKKEFNTSGIDFKVVQMGHIAANITTQTHANKTRKRTNLAVAVQAVKGVVVHTVDIQHLVHGADDTSVTSGQQVLDVVEGAVDEDAAVVPSAAFDADDLVG